MRDLPLQLHKISPLLYQSEHALLPARPLHFYAAIQSILSESENRRIAHICNTRMRGTCSSAFLGIGRTRSSPSPPWLMYCLRRLQIRLAEIFYSITHLLLRPITRPSPHDRFSPCPFEPSRRFSQEAHSWLSVMIINPSILQALQEFLPRRTGHEVHEERGVGATRILSLGSAKDVVTKRMFPARGRGNVKHPHAGSLGSVTKLVLIYPSIFIGDIRYH